MCGRYNVIDDPLVQELMATLGIPVHAKTRLDMAPSTKDQIVYETSHVQIFQDAPWSLPTSA
jgi:putative SOS response-associated peptidase YedK